MTSAQYRDALARLELTQTAAARHLGINDPRVVAALKDGMSIRQAAEALGMHKSKLERLRKRAMETGELP